MRYRQDKHISWKKYLQLPEISGRNFTTGFTLLEVMLALVFLTMMSALPFFVSRFALSSNNLRLTEQTIVHSLRQAQLFARSEKRDASWGGKVSSTSIILFEGNSYLTRSEGSDRIMQFPSTVTTTGIDEVVFEKFTGEPSVTGDIIVSDGVAPKTISIRAHGFLNY